MEISCKVIVTDRDIVAKFEITYQHGLARHFGKTGDLNLESVASKGIGSVYATKKFGTVRAFLLLGPFTKCS
jgi:hypothetical protein